MDDLCPGTEIQLPKWTASRPRIFWTSQRIQSRFQPSFSLDIGSHRNHKYQLEAYSYWPFCTPLFPRLCYFEMSLQLFAQPPLPPTKLGRYRTLSPLAGVRVSPLQLGAMSIGDKWHQFGMGSMDKESSFKLLDAYFDAGVSRIIALITVIVNCDVVLILFAFQGNFIDTANN